MMSLDEIFDLTAGVYFYLYNNRQAKETKRFKHAYVKLLTNTINKKKNDQDSYDLQYL